MCMWWKAGDAGEHSAGLYDFSAKTSSQLAQRLSGRHRRGQGDVEAARAGPHRDQQAGVGGIVDMIRNAGRFAAEQKHVVSDEGKIGIGQRGPGREQHKAPPSGARSLNVALTAAMAAGEALRQLG